MKRGHYVIIGGAALFVIGIAVIVAWALPIGEQLKKETALLQGSALGAGQSEQLSLQVTNTTRPLSVFAASTDTSVPIVITVTSPDGETLLDFNFTENTVMSAQPTVPGAYTLNVTNAGQLETTVDVVFGRVPGLEQDNQVAFETYGGVLTGFGIIIAGIIVMIAGVAVVIVDRRRRNLP